MERVIHEQLSSHLLFHSLLSPYQHGFQSSKSTTTNLLEATTDWLFASDSNVPMDVFYLDFTRAFDSVTYSKLFVKLEWYGIGGSLLAWLISFLTDRYQCVIL